MNNMLLFIIFSSVSFIIFVVCFWKEEELIKKLGFLLEKEWNIFNKSNVDINKEAEELKIKVYNKYKGLENANKIPILEYSNTPIPSYYRQNGISMGFSNYPTQIRGSEILFTSFGQYNDYILFNKELTNAKEPEKKKPIRKLILD